MGSNLKCGRIILLIFFAVFHNYSLLKAQEGESLFKKTCLACHTIGKGKVIGPDLKDVSKRRDVDWLVNFIRSSTKMINSKDVDAVSLFEEYNKIPMPDANLSDSEIKQVIAYIDEQSTKTIAVDSIKVESVDVVSGNIDMGRELFIGKKLLENGGSACISCHYLSDSHVFYGGKMAKDLTGSYEILKSPGINSVLKFLTFPAMANTYEKKELTDTEISDLTAFLKYTSDNRVNSISQSFNLMFFLYSLLFFIALLFFLHIFWRNKKPDSVKEHIYNR